MHNQPSLLLGAGNRGQVILTGSDFERHKVISGITGSGKSTFLAWIALSLLRQGVAFSLVDPHGDLCRLILQLLMSSDFFSNKRSFDRLWFIDFNRTNAAIPFNVLRGQADSHSIAQNVLEAIHRAFPTVGTTAALDNTFLACCYVLAENKRPITDIQRLLLDGAYRKSLLKHVSDPLVVQFFESKLAGEKANGNLIDSTMRRSFLLTFSMQLRNTLGQVENKLNFSDIISGTSVLYSLGGLDEESKRLLGCLLMVGYEQAFLSRASQSPDRRVPHHLIVDEFPLFSASGDSFGVILDQCRKYLGTLYLAFQQQAQLSKGIAGSLQNAIHITMKAGVEDSNALVSRFYRPVGEQSPNIFDLFRPSLPDLFAKVKNAQEARLIFENLQRQEAIITVHEKAQKIRTPTLPIGKLDHAKLESLEAAYARHVLTPVKDIERSNNSPRLNVVPKSQPLQRRTFRPATETRKPLTLFVGDLEQDIQTALTLFHYLTLDQLVKLLGKKEGNKNYLRKKLTDMSSTVAVTLFPRVTGGKPLQVFHLSANSEKKQMFLEHTLDVNEVLIAGVLLPIIQPSLILVDVKSERTLKTLLSSCPCIPDGLVTYQTKAGEIIHIGVEIDRATENRERIAEKYTSSSVWIETMGLEAVTLAFIVTTDDNKRVSSLCDIAGGVVTDLADILLFATAASDTIAPTLYTTHVFKALDGSSHALIEQPF